MFKIDFSEAGRKGSTKGNREAKFNVAHSKTYPIEYFWLCEKCARAMNLTLADSGEIHLVPLQKPVPVSSQKTQHAVAS